MDEMTLTLNSPITEEQWDMIEDVDFDHTDIITFYTKHGKEVEFVKRKTGKWVGVKEYCDHLNEEAEREGKGNRYMPSGMNIRVYCNQCWEPNDRQTTYCPNCGAKMEGEQS